MEQTSQVIFDKNSIEFVTVAAEYCGFIERARGADRKTFVDTALKILPLLYLKASLIPECEQIGEGDLEVFVTEDDYEVVSPDANDFFDGLKPFSEETLLYSKTDKSFAHFMRVKK